MRCLKHHRADGKWCPGSGDNIDAYAEALPPPRPARCIKCGTWETFFDQVDCVDQVTHHSTIPAETPELSHAGYEGSVEQLRAHVIGELELSSAEDAAHAIAHVDALIGGVARVAFDAGWNATKWVMCNQSPEETAASMRKQQEDALRALCERFGFHAIVGSGTQATPENSDTTRRSEAPK